MTLDSCIKRRAYNGKKRLNKGIGSQLVPEIGQRGRRIGCQATTCDVFHPACGRVEVDGESVARNPAQEGEADAADFATVHPDSLHAFIPLPLDSKGGQRVDEPPFDDVNDVGHGAFAFPLAPLENRVAHDLTRSVPCQASATVNRYGFVIGWRGDAVVAGSRANGHHLWVGQDEQGVGNDPFDALLLEVLHQRLRPLVGYATEFPDIQHRATASKLSRGAKSTRTPFGLVEVFHGGLHEGDQGDGGKQELSDAFAGCNGERVPFPNPRSQDLELATVV